MKREDFIEAARTLASEHGLGIVDCLRRRGWSIASEVADELGIHISTATKDLSSLHSAGLLERRKAGRKTRPAYEYKLRVDRIVLDLDISAPADGSREEFAEFCRSFFQRLFLKAGRMGWRSLESEVLQELGFRGETLCDAISLELGLGAERRRVPEMKSAFLSLSERTRELLSARLGESATARIFDQTAREIAAEHPGAFDRYRLISETGVPHGR